MWKDLGFMEHWLLVAALTVFLIAVFIREAYEAGKRKKRFEQFLHEHYGKVPVRDDSYERTAHIKGYYRRHREEGQIDDITWNDLDMDHVFKRINDTYSATGEEYLYYMLRNLEKDQEKLKHLEELISWFDAHEDERVTFQYCMSELGYTGKYSLYDYLDHLDCLGERSDVKNLLTNALYLPIIVLMFYEFPLGIAALSVLCVYRIVTYFKEKKQIESYIVCFAYVTRLLKAAEEICKIKIDVAEAEMNCIHESIHNLRGICSGFQLVASLNNPKTGGNPLEVLFDYIRMMFHVDMFVFNRMLRKIRKKVDSVDELISALGLLEASISIASFRASLTDGYCVPVFVEEENCIRVEEGYHPLIKEPVKNSIQAQRGVLLTGSNASGKSTFLKMMAVNAILAQTIHTCTAKRYESLMWSIYSSMALRDNIESGESYYIVEIKSLKRILDAVSSGEKVLCFVDEVLRGTNTVERIAASTQILKSLGGGNVVCFAATHDIELTQLLQTQYDNYHFEEEIKNGDISFPYKLRSGAATTRNAIMLLEIIGYSEEVTRQAKERAEHFVKTGIWQA